MIRGIRAIGSCFVATAMAAAAGSAAGNLQPPLCPIADGDVEPWAAGGIAISPTETIEHSSDSFGLLESLGHISLGYYRTTAGTLDLSLRGRLWVAINGDHYEVPPVFGQLAVRSRWDLRLEPGWTLRTEALPGYYAAIEHLELDDFNVPLAFSAIAAADRTLAGQAGVSLYPGFENWLDPLLRLRWRPWPQFTADLGYPETRLHWQPLAEIALFGGYQFNRIWQFSLSRSDPKGEFMLRDQRLYTGVEVGVARWLTFSAHLAYLLNRELDYEAGLFQDARVDDGILFAVGVSGEF
ncbi:MAG: hypothetical protein N2652_10560 [Kiritimatiellae bacterium]|nr:hypothetical protein [Kiritimatiellia bacterium]